MPLPPDVRPDRWMPSRGRPAIDAEIEFHIAARVEELVARGWPQAAARAEAWRQFGAAEPVQRACQDIDRRKERRMRRVTFWRDWHLDVRYALRGLRASPLFALTVLLTFALGIGANAAVFGLVDRVLLRPLPFAHRARLVRVWESIPREGLHFGQVTVADARDWTAEARGFDGFGLFRWRNATLSLPDEAVPLAAADVSANFFDLLGATPIRGRTFAAGEDRSASGSVVMLSHRVWAGRFGSDSGLVGRSVRVNGGERVVIGVLPSDFVNPIGEPVDVWMPNDFDQIARDPERARRMHVLAGIARLARGTSVEQARAELERVGAALETRYPEQNAGHRPVLLPLAEAGVRDLKSTLYLLSAAVVCVLLIACGNVANLVFARALGRTREFALRAALGAGRLRVARQVLVEQLVLAIGGAGIGVLGAYGALRAIAAAPVGRAPRMLGLGVDLRLVLVAGCLAVVAAAVAGLVPALLALKPDLIGSLRGGGHGSTLSRGAHRARATLVAVQVGLAALLLLAGGLTLRSLSRLLGTDVGFRIDRVWTFQAPLPPARYQEPARVDEFERTFLDRIRGIPGVEVAAASYALPMENRSTTGMEIEGEVRAPGPAPEIGYNAADGEYFRTLGIPVVAGRTFDARDRLDGPGVAVINEAAGRRFFPGRDPIGARIRGNSTDPWQEVIGIVGDIRRDARAIAPVPEVYFALSQDLTRSPSYSVRVRGDAQSVLAGIRAALRELDPDLPVAAVTPLEEVVGRTVAGPRLVTVVLASFAGIALALAAVGIYGVIAFLVAERTREIAVRLALGAAAGQMLRQTAGRGLAPVLVGLVGGIVAAIFLGRSLAGFLFEVRPLDPVTHVAVAALVLLTGAAGCLLPAVRASRIQPAEALRE